MESKGSIAHAVGAIIVSDISIGHHLRFQVDSCRKMAFFVLIGIVGFCMGSLFNFYTNHEIIVLTERNGEDISMNLNIVHGFAQVFTGLSQVLIGSVGSRNSIFLVFLAFAVVSMFDCRRMIFGGKSDEQET